VYATVAFAFVLYLADPYGPDFIGVVYVGAATGLVIDIFDAHGSNIACASRRLHGHRPHEFRAFVEFGFCDRTKNNAVRLCDEHVNARGQVFFVDLVFAEVEIQPAFFGPDRTACHRYGDERSEEMHAGVHSHVSESPLPVNRRIDRVAGLEPVIIAVELVPYLIGRIAFPRV
jgi:hypothetical protein